MNQMNSQQVQLMERVGDGILQVAAAEERKLDGQLKVIEKLGEYFNNFKFCFSIYNTSLHACYHLLVINIITFIYLDEDDFEALRQKRKLLLQKKMKQEQDWRQLGHGRLLIKMLILIFLCIYSILFYLIDILKLLIRKNFLLLLKNLHA
jgi:hypothetical protein